MKSKIESGFTIIEVITYLAISSLIFAVILPTFYFVTTSTKANHISLAESEESNFISSKINNLISSAVSIQVPQNNQASNVLKITLGGAEPGVMEISQHSHSIFLKRNNTDERLSSRRITFSDLNFIHHKNLGNSPESISYSFIVNSKMVPTTTVEILRYE